MCINCTSAHAARSRESRILRVCVKYARWLLRRRAAPRAPYLFDSRLNSAYFCRSRQAFPAVCFISIITAESYGFSCFFFSKKVPIKVKHYLFWVPVVQAAAHKAFIALENVDFEDAKWSNRAEILPNHSRNSLKSLTENNITKFTNILL